MKRVNKINREFNTGNFYSGYYTEAARHGPVHEKFVVPWQMDDKETGKNGQADHDPRLYWDT
jgi:hypothetical protein